MVTISLDGDLLPPFLILPRKTIPDELLETGIRKGIDVEIQCSDNGYMNSTIFYNYIKDFLIPKIEKKRKELNIENENALILLDNSSSHINESVNILCAMHNILLLSYPPHSSHILQPLDLLLFSIVKKRSYGMTTYNGYSDTTIRILNIVNSIHKAGIPHHVRLSFLRAGIKIKMNDTTSIIEIDQNPAIERFNHNMETINVVTKENNSQPKIRKRPSFGFLNSHCYRESMRGLCPYCYSNLLDDDDEFVFIEEESEFEEDLEIIDEQ